MIKIQLIIIKVVIQIVRNKTLISLIIAKHKKNMNNKSKNRVITRKNNNPSLVNN